MVEATYKEPFDLLSSSPKFEYGDVVETIGFEPTTSCVQSRRSSQLSYVPGVTG